MDYTQHGLGVFAMKKIKAILLIIVIAALASGCSQGIKYEMSRYTKPLRGSDYGSLKAKKHEQQQQQQLNALGVNDKPDKLPHEIKSASYSSELSNHVSSVRGVADARVFTADQHAYVALVLDNSGQGMLKSKPSGEREAGTNQIPYTAENSIHNNPFRFFLTVNDTSQLSDRFVRTVTESVKTLQPSIKEVHISANKEFMYYMDEFAQVAWGGESLEPYLDQFNILINHQFFNGKIMPNSLKYYRNQQ